MYKKIILFMLLLSSLMSKSVRLNEPTRFLDLATSPKNDRIIIKGVSRHCSHFYNNIENDLEYNPSPKEKEIIKRFSELINYCKTSTNINTKYFNVTVKDELIKNIRDIMTQKGYSKCVGTERKFLNFICSEIYDNHLREQEEIQKLEKELKEKKLEKDLLNEMKKIWKSTCKSRCDSICDSICESCDSICESIAQK